MAASTSSMTTITLVSPRETTIVMAYTPTIPSPLSPRRTSGAYSPTLQSHHRLLRTPPLSSHSSRVPPPCTTLPQRRAPHAPHHARQQQQGSPPPSPPQQHSPQQQPRSRRSAWSSPPSSIPRINTSSSGSNSGSGGGGGGGGGGTSSPRRGPVSPTQRLMRQKAAAAWRSLVVMRNSGGGEGGPGGGPGGNPAAPLNASLLVAAKSAPSNSAASTKDGSTTPNRDDIMEPRPEGRGRRHSRGEGLSSPTVRAELSELADRSRPSSSSPPMPPPSSGDTVPARLSKIEELENEDENVSDNTNTPCHPLLQHPVHEPPPPPLPPRPRHRRRSYRREDQDGDADDEGAEYTEKEQGRWEGKETEKEGDDGKQKEQTRDDDQREKPRADHDTCDEKNGDEGIVMKSYRNGHHTRRLSVVSCGHVVSGAGGFGDGTGGSTGLGIMSASVDTEKRQEVVYRYQDQRQNDVSGNATSRSMPPASTLPASPADPPRYLLPLRVLWNKGLFLVAGLLCIIGFLSAFGTNFHVVFLTIKS